MPFEPMRVVLSVILLFLLSGCKDGADPTVSGSMSDRLAFDVSYESAQSRFEVVLSNQTSRRLKLHVDPHQFHGRIVVTPVSGRAVEYLDAAFLPLFMTGIIDVPFHTLHSHKKINWVLPVSRLKDIHGNEVSVQALQGASVHATLDELAIISRSSNYISDNAKQVSGPITISP